MSDFKRCKTCGNPVDPEVAKSHDGACPWCLAAFTFGPEPSAPPPATSTTQFGKYVRTERLGSGGMGEVWKALDTELNRWVALKFLKDEDPSVVARFQREAKTAAALSHSNIAAIYEVGEIDGRHFIAMQHIQGRTMAKFPKKDRRLIVRLFRDAARAIDHAHRHGIIHRDLKPENLMVEEREEGWAVVVLDFGLARPIEGGEKLSQSGEVYGTAPYMSPEQARGEHLDERADVYALGATMYDVLTGKAPFEAGNLLEVIRKVGHDEPVRPRKINPRIHRDLETIVMKCLEKDRERRYSNARELADDLERFLNSDPIVARPPSTLYRLKMKLGKRKAVVATGAAGFLGMIIVAALILKGHEKVVDARAEAGTHVDLARLKIDQLDQMMRVDEDRTVQIERLAAGAREELDAALRICPEHEEACFEMGRMFALMQRTGKAIEFFTRAIKLAPRQAKAYLGRAALNLEIYEDLRHFGREGRVLDESEQSRKVLGRLIEDLKKVRALSSEVPLLKYAEGMVLFAQGGYAEAAARFGQYLELAPADADGWLWRGHALGHAKAPEEAIQSLTRALKLRPRLAGAYVLRGIAHYDLDRFDEAIADYDRAIALNPKDPVAHLNRGNAKDMKGLYDEAIADMSKAIDLNPKYGGAYINRGHAKGLKGLHDEAIADLSKAIELDPKDDNAFLNRGNEYQLKGLHDAGIADYNKALELNPKDPKIWTARGSAKSRKKLFDEAIADLEEALKLDPKYAPAYNNRGWAKRSKGRHVEAIADFTRAVELDPKLEVAWGNRALSKHDLGRYDEAIADHEQCIKLNPGDFKNYVNRGVSRQAKGLVDEAIADFTKAIALEPKDWLAWMNRGYSKSEMGRLDEGIADMTKAIELAPEEKDSYINRGVAYSKKGLEDLAIADHAKVIALDPKEPLGYYNRALALEKLGRFDEARTDFEKALAVAQPGWRFWSATQGLLAHMESRRAFRVAYTLYHQGKFREAIEKYKAILDKYPEAPDTKTAAYNVACGYALLGEKKDALDWLERCVQMGWNNFIHMKRDKDLDSLRGEERYRKLLEEAGMD